jgi:cytochrome c
MELLDKLVIPQSEANLMLLNLLQMVALTALLIYSGILFGSISLSVWFNRKARKEQSLKFAYMAKDLADLITSGKLFAFGLGIVPFLAIIMVYIQLLHQSNSFVPKYLIISFVLYLISIALIYIYQHATELNYFFEFFKTKIDPSKTDKQTEEFLSFYQKTETLHSRTGFWGVVLLGISLYIFIASLTLAVENWRWTDVDTMLELTLSFSAFFKYMHFISASLAMTGVAFLIKKFKWQEEPTFADEDYIEYSKKFNLSVSLTFTMILPLFYILNLIITPKTALNDFIFGFSLIGLLILFVLLHFLYEMVRKNKFVYISLVFYLLIIVIGISQVKEQLVFRYANAQHTAKLAQEYEVFYQDMLAKAGRGIQEISGEDIYKGKCIACHDFERKVVGPPHKLVLPKYINNPEALAKFILNPVKVDPAYPPMPAQGLRPKEAEAVAKYMIEHYGPMLK